MKFSVVIPLYNKARYIERALDSVLSQTVQAFEIVVVNDGSVDAGPDLVRKYTDPRIRLIEQPNAGVSAARNRGIDEAKADLIAFLDADDEWDEVFLDHVSFLVEEYPDAGLFATSYRMFNGTDTQFPQIPNLDIPLHGHGILKNYLRTMLGAPPFYTSSTVVRTEIMQKIGGFPVGVAPGEDLDTWLRIYFDSPMVFMYSYSVIYYTGVPASATDGWIPDDDFAPVCTAQNFIDSGQYDANLIEDLQEYIAHNQLEIAKSLIFHNEHGRARTQLHKIGVTKHYKYEKIFWLFWASMPPFVTRMALRFKRFFRHLGQFIKSLMNEGHIRQPL